MRSSDRQTHQRFVADLAPSNQRTGRLFYKPVPVPSRYVMTWTAWLLLVVLAFVLMASLGLRLA